MDDPERIEIVKFFCNCPVTGIDKTVILDPTGLLLSALLERQLLTECSTGAWWPTARFISTEESYTIVRCPQASLVIDPVIVFTGIAESLFLVGLAGSLSTMVPTGTLIRATKAETANAPARFPLLRHPSLEYATQGAIVFSVSSFFSHGPDELESLVSKGITAIEMETYHFYERAKNNYEEFISLLLVSDIPGREPFYNRPLSKGKLHEGMLRLFALIRSREM
jgi:hypothetical protein